MGEDSQVNMLHAAVLRVEGAAAERKGAVDELVGFLLLALRHLDPDVFEVVGDLAKEGANRREALREELLHPVLDRRVWLSQRQTRVACRDHSALVVPATACTRSCTSRPDNGRLEALQTQTKRACKKPTSKGHRGSARVSACHEGTHELSQRCQPSMPATRRRAGVASAPCSGGACPATASHTPSSRPCSSRTCSPATTRPRPSSQQGPSGEHGAMPPQGSPAGSCSAGSPSLRTSSWSGSSRSTRTHQQGPRRARPVLHRLRQGRGPHRGRRRAQRGGGGPAAVPTAPRPQHRRHPGDVDRAPRGRWHLACARAAACTSCPRGSPRPSTPCARWFEAAGGNTTFRLPGARHAGRSGHHARHRQPQPRR
jgi:hypothetical protein